MDLLIQAVLVHLLNTRKLKFSQKASSDDQQSTSLSSTASSSVCLQLSCLICSFSAENCTFRWSYWRCEILTSIFPNLCHPYQLLNIVSKMFANCAKNLTMILQCSDVSLYTMWVNTIERYWLMVWKYWARGKFACHGDEGIQLKTPDSFLLHIRPGYKCCVL